MMKKYDSYKNSEIEWIGEIPEHWEKLAIRRITKEHKQGYYSSKSYTNEGLRLVRITDLDKNGNIDVSSSPFVKLTKPEEKVFKVRTGDFLFPRTGSIGLLGLVNQDMEAAFASYLICFRFKKDALSSFLKFYFMSEVFLNGLLSDLHGGVNQNIHAENIKNQYFVLPPIPEQEKIIKFLNKRTSQIDNLIQKKQQMIALLEEEKTAVINEAVTRGLNPDAVMKDSGIEWIGEMPEHWKKLTIRRLTKEHKQGYYSPQSYTSDGFRLIRITDLDRDGNIDISSSPFVKLADSEKKAFKIRKGDFLFPRTGSIGLLGVAKQDMDAVFASYLICFRFTHKALSSFMKFYFMSEVFLNGLLSDLHGGVNQNIHAENIKNQYLGLPPVFEQEKIANYINLECARIDKIITHCNKEIQLLQEYRTALIYEAVTGKIDVRDYQIEQTLSPVLTE